MPGYHPAPRSALFANLPIERDVLDHGMEEDQVAKLSPFALMAFIFRAASAAPDQVRSL
jgi:hypothetical protein